MKTRSKQTSLRSIKKGHPAFTIQDGTVIANRAGFEINKSCPDGYKKIIIDAIQYGWLTPVATLTEKEIMYWGLSNAFSDQ